MCSCVWYVCEMCVWRLVRVLYVSCLCDVSACVSLQVSEWWFNAVSATEAIFTARTWSLQVKLNMNDIIIPICVSR